MASLKRKRSDSELSISSASTSAFSSPPRPASNMFVFGQSTPSPFPSSWVNRSATPAHLPSRTMKRFRDNRPSEEEVHQRTLGILYEAQRNSRTQMEEDHTPQEPETEQDHQEISSVTPQPAQNQRSLHSFWKIPGQAPPITSISSPQCHSATSATDELGRCESEDYEMT